MKTPNRRKEAAKTGKRPERTEKRPKRTKPSIPCIMQQVELKTTLGQRVYNQRLKNAIKLCNQYDVVIPILAKYVQHHPDYKDGTELGFEFSRRMDELHDVSNKFLKRIEDLITSHREKLKQIAADANYEIKESPLAYKDRVIHEITVVSPTQLLFIDLLREIDDIAALQDLLWFAGLIDNVENAKMQHSLQNEFLKMFTNITNTVTQTTAYLKNRHSIERAKAIKSKIERVKRHNQRREEREKIKQQKQEMVSANKSSEQIEHMEL